MHYIDVRILTHPMFFVNKEFTKSKKLLKISKAKQLGKIFGIINVIFKNILRKRIR